MTPHSTAFLRSTLTGGVFGKRVQDRHARIGDGCRVVIALDLTHERLATNDAEGTVDDSAVDAYLRADRLDPFGFSGWIGREPHGVASGYLHSHLRPGSVVEAAAPRGEFVLDEGTSPLLLISAGIGVYYARLAGANIRQLEDAALLAY